MAKRTPYKTRQKVGFYNWPRIEAECLDQQISEEDLIGKACITMPTLRKFKQGGQQTRKLALLLCGAVGLSVESITLPSETDRHA